MTTIKSKMPNGKQCGEMALFTHNDEYDTTIYCVLEKEHKGHHAYRYYSGGGY